MADGILYLDIDDEITSAAARVRAVVGGRVAVVLPYGSRVATSRINFRLLARDALTHEKRLSVVSSDSATRALAASAGLPVFASVQEYEASLPPLRETPTDAAVVAGVASAAAVRKAKRAAASGTEGSTDAIWTETARVDAPPASAEAPSERRDVLASTGAAVATSVAGASAAVVSPPPDLATPPNPMRRADLTVTRSRGPARRASVAVGLAVLALALLVGGVGAYLFLPSAAIVVTPRQGTIGPIQLIVVADPATTQPDAAAPSVPAQTLSVDVTASDTFPATGKRVEETAATGIVRFRNVDFTSSNFIPAGSIVSGSGGIRFRTDKSITIGAASLVGLQIFPKTASVGVTAVAPGPEGNLEPNTILAIPKGESPVTLSVTNPDATTGGARVEFPKVVRADVDAALVALDAALKVDFTEQVADPSLPPAGTTAFPETAKLGPSTPDQDPAALIGKEAATFDLGASATGTVIAVNADPVAAIAESRLHASVVQGSQLVEGSVNVQVGAAVVVGDQITFPVSATATQVAVLDPARLEALILGKTPVEAKLILTPYGSARITLSPDWVGTIPTFESRVAVTIDTGAAGAPGASPGPSPSPSP